MEGARCRCFFGGADFHAEIRLRFLWDELSISQSHNIASDLGFLRKSHHIIISQHVAFLYFTQALRHVSNIVNYASMICFSAAKIAEVQGSKSEENIHATKEVVSSGKNTTNQKQHVDSNGSRKDPQKSWG